MTKNGARKAFPKPVQTRVFLDSKRKCAFCFVLDNDATEKDGQIAHLDRDRTNVATENAVWLCANHHARYDSVSRQTKGYTAHELKAYRSQLYEYVAQGNVWPDAVQDKKMKSHRGVTSLDLHDRRIPIYRKTNDFVRYVMQGSGIELNKLFEFARETDEALFLFDAGIAEYLGVLFKGALRVRTLGAQMKRNPPNLASLADEETQILVWFSEQFQEIRSRFFPFLQVYEPKSGF